MKFQGVEICCPACKGDLVDGTGSPHDGLVCSGCQRTFPVQCGIPDLRMFPDPYIEPEKDRAKGQHVAEQFDKLNFVELVEFYYGMTSVVPPQHAKQYTRGILAGPVRAEATLESWETMMGMGKGNNAVGPVLEVGCGTGPLVLAAHRRGSKVVGVDIAFRWLVVAKKRLAEHGIQIPLICACAEALPFRDETFTEVMADSTLEHLCDQKKGLREGFRVLRPTGHLLVTTPNRFSVGPDPHTGLWGGGYLPKAIVDRYVRSLGGIPPKRRLLSQKALARLLRETGFLDTGVAVPRIPEGQRCQYGTIERLAIDLYNSALTVPWGKEVFGAIGPVFHAVATKPRS